MAGDAGEGEYMLFEKIPERMLIKNRENSWFCTEGSDLPVVRKVNTRLYTAWKDNLSVSKNSI